MLGFVTRREKPPQNAGKLDWKEIAMACDLNGESLRVAKQVAQHGFDAIIRWLEETETVPLREHPRHIPTNR